MLHTTFNLAKQANACDTSKMRAALGPDWLDDKPIPLTLVIEHSGIDDAIWALRCTLEPSERLARLFACDCAGRVLPLFERRLPDDARPRRSIGAARRFALGEASADELAAAADAAWDAEAAEEAAAAAAADAAWDAEAAEAAALSVAAAAWAAAWAAEEAAWAAAWAAASAAASASEARKAERQWQARRLREMLEEHS